MMDTRQIQTLLADHGFWPGPVDGIDGNLTRAALRDFERIHGSVDNADPPRSRYIPREVRGDYGARQAMANRMGAIAYLEFHFNSAQNRGANYSSVVVASDSPPITRQWGTDHARRVSKEFGITMRQPDGLWVGGYQGRGNGNVNRTDCPAILIEPWFISNPEGARWAWHRDYWQRLAQVTADSICEFFGNGTVAFSLGHKYRDNAPADRGAISYAGQTEAELAEPIMDETMRLLFDAGKQPTVGRPAVPHIRPATTGNEDSTVPEDEGPPKPWSK